MMKGYRGYWPVLALVALALLASCSTTYVTEIRAVGPNTFIEGGREVSTQEKSGVEAYVTFLDYPPGMMMFDVQVANKTGFPLNIKQSDIFLVPMESPDEKSAPGNAAYSVRAIEPKVLASNIDKEIEQANNAYKTSAAVDVGLTILGAIIYGALDDHDDPEVYAGMAGDLIIRRVDASVDHDRFMKDLNYRKEFVETKSLKDTTISNGGRAYGAVIVPLYNLPKYFKVVVPLNGTFFEFPYKVVVTKQ